MQEKRGLYTPAHNGLLPGSVPSGRAIILQTLSCISRKPMLFKTLSGQTIIGLCALFAATFTAITSEVAPVGLLIDMANSFHITEGKAGLAVSAYALVVALAAVPLTILTAKINRKTLMLWALLGYIASNLIAALAPTFAILCLGRAVGGAAHALMMSIVSAYAAHLVPPRMTGRAISFVFGGTSLGSVLGVPGTAAIGQLAGWRVSMMVVTGLAAILTVCIAFFLPKVEASSSSVHLPSFRTPGVARVFAVVIAVNTLFFLGHNLLYTYVSPLLMSHGLPESALSIALLITGGVSILGLWAAGQMVDSKPALGLLVAGLITACGMGSLCGSLLSGWSAVAAVGLWCAGYAALIPVIMSGAIRSRATTADIAGAAVNASSNVGILFGSAAGGMILNTAGLSVLPPMAVGIVIMATALGLCSPVAFPRVLHDHSESES
ncbi:MFS transporter [Acetobacter pasteurianus]|uniref:MFS transporter n=1 Tax=Acetobacter pasteurianus TaxID=438 RepID=UPI00162694B8|nr:MFS transporter [Acetobacter pasteurianus]